MPTRAERREARREERVAEVAKTEDDVVILVEDFADNDKVPTGVKIHVLSQIRQLLEGVEVTGFVDPGSLVKRPILALGSGSDTTDDAAVTRLKAFADAIGETPERLVEFLIKVSDPLRGLDETELGARASAMGNIANGTTEVNDDGTLKVADDLKKADEKLGKLERKFGPVITALEGLTDADKRSREKGILLIANGTTEVDNLGKPVVATPADVADLQQQLDDANNAKTAAEQAATDANNAVTAANAVIDDIVGHTTVRGGRLVGKVNSFSQTTRDRLNPPSPTTPPPAPGTP